jgi:hypothetical protein
MCPDRYQFIARRKGLDRVMSAIYAAIEAGYDPVKVNVCVMNGFNEDEIVDLVAWTQVCGAASIERGASCLSAWQGSRHLPRVPDFACACLGC